MANINVSVAASNVSVTEVISNVIITDPDNVIIGNVTTTQSVVNVSTSPSVVTVGTGPIPTPVTNAEIRAGVSASAPILYNQSTGVFSLDSNASFIGKTTDNLSEGSTNLYFTTARARQSISGSGDISYDANTGVISYTGTPGDITAVIAGSGLTGGGTTGDVTLNVGAGTGIIVNADNVAVNMGAFTTTDLAEGANLYYTTTRANSAIDTRVNKAFVEGLGVSYTSLTNKPTIPTHTSNLVNDSGFITSATANVVSVNGETGVVVLDTGDIAEGANLYYTTARANTAIDARVNKAYVNALGIEYSSLANAPTNVSFFTNDAGYLVAGNLASLTANVDSINGKTGIVTLTTTDIAEGTNLYFTAARVRSNISAGENITYNSTSGIIGLSNALANVNSVGSESGQNLALTTNTKLTVNERINGGTTLVANIDGKGYALQNQNALSAKLPFNYTGPTANITTMAFDGIATSGSNVITGINIVEEAAGGGSNPANINLLLLNTFFRNGATGSAYPFPEGTRLLSVDAANSRITMSQAATASLDFSFFPAFELAPGLHDVTTGLTMRFNSPYTNSGSGSRNTIQSMILQPTQPVYGYPVTGFTINDFDVATYGSISDYSLGDDYTNLFIGKTEIEAPKTVMNFPRGLTIGNTDLTNRAEGDSIPSYGLNMLWDGTANTTTDYAGQTPVTQLLLKQYTQNSLASTSPQNGGPRIFFTAAQGNKNQSTTETYLRTNTELGRITWWCASQFAPGLGTTAPPAYINAVANRDMTGGHNGGVGLYLSASPNNNAGRRGLFAAHQLGTTLIASSNTTTTGASQPIVFAPMATDTGGNSVTTFNNTLAATNYQWANINYDNATAKSGSRLSITNGASTVAGRNGNISLVLDRNDNGAGFGSKEWAFKLRSGQTDLVLTEDDVVRTTFSGGNITASYFIGDGSALTNVSATAFTNFAVSGQSTVVADSAGDTLTFVAGSGMSITTDAITDTITFTSTYGNAQVAAFLAAYGSNTISTTGNITAGNVNVTGVTFNTARNVAPTSGQIVYNADYGSHQMGLNGSNVIIAGQDLVVYANNAEANTLLKGEVVYLFGATGNKASIKRAVNTADATSAKTVGIVKQDIAAGALGYVVTQGVVDGINLGAYTAGDSLWLANVAGTFTNVKPSAPEHIVFIGVVERANAGNGQVLVRVQNGFELNEIHDVKVNGVQQNDILIRNSGNTLWVNQSFGTTVTNSNITLKQYQETRVDLGSTGGNITLNMANGSIFAMTATSSISNIALSNAGVGASGTLIITQDGTGSKTLTTTSAWKFAQGSKTLTTTANAVDIISFFTDGTTVYAALSKGYA